MTSSSRKLAGPLLVTLAAFLWATDALVRYPAIDSVDPSLIVFVEHLLAVIILLPWMIFRYPKQFLTLDRKEWGSAIFAGGAGSALATLLFTASFKFINPSVAVLLQKLQPVMVVIFAFLFLGERPQKSFYLGGSIALLAGIALSFPELDFHFLSHGLDMRSLGLYLTLLAAIIWSVSTVSGKFLLQKTHPIVATFWRFFFGLIAITFIMMTPYVPAIPSWKVLMTSQSMLFYLLYLSLIPGLLAMMAYYAGLAKTPATITTFIELLYPIGAVILNTLFLHTPLTTTQSIAGVTLLLAVTFISHQSSAKKI